MKLYDKEYPICYEILVEVKKIGQDLRPDAQLHHEPFDLTAVG